MPSSTPTDSLPFGELIQAYVAGDYAGALRETEEFIGTHVILEVARIRLVVLQRLGQSQTAADLGRRLLASLPDTHELRIDRALLSLILGESSLDEVLQMAETDKERCRSLYYAAALKRTAAGFEAARPALEQCVELNAACVEHEVARLELATAQSTGGGGPAPPVWQAGDLIERTYRVRSMNTGGAMSIVYFAWHEKWNLELALKVPRPDVFAQANAWDRLTAEASTWVDLGLHPNIVSAYYVRRIGGVPVIVMEKVDGGSLKEALAAGRVKAIDSVLDVAIQVARALDYAAQKRPGFVHRDIKPANVLLTAGGTAKLADFGLANATGSMAGTPAYLAPEVWVRSDSVGPAADVYSFGIMLFEMLTGRRPFALGAGGRFAPIPDVVPSEPAPSEAPPSDDPLRTRTWPGDPTQLMPEGRHALLELMRAHQYESPPEPHQLRSDIPVDLSQYCLRLLAKDPAARPSISDVVSELSAHFRAVTGRDDPPLIPEAQELLADSLNNHALSMLDLGLDEEATRLWEQGQQANPLDAAIVFNTGVRAWRRGELTDADLLERLDDIAASHPDPALIQYLKALVHLECGDGPSAWEEVKACDELEAISQEAFDLVRSRAQEQATAAGQSNRRLEGHLASVDVVRLNRDGTRAITGSSDRTLRSWDLDTGAPSAPLGEHAAPINGLDVTADWSAAVSIDVEGHLQCWDLASGIRRWSVGTGFRMIGFVSISRSGQMCLAGGPFLENTPCSLRSVETGQRLATLKGPVEHMFNTFRFLGEHDMVVATESDAMRFWRPSDGEPFPVVARVPLCLLPRRPIEFDHDGQFFVAPCDNVDIALMDVPMARVVRTFRGHKDAVLHLSSPPKLDHFVSAGSDATVRHWDVQTGRCLRTIHMGAEHVTALAISADGGRILAGTESGLALAWKWPESSWTAPYLLSRPLDSDRMREIAQTVRAAERQTAEGLAAGEFTAAKEAIRRARDQPGCRRHPRLLAAWLKLYGRLEKRSLGGAWQTRRLEGQRTYVQSVRSNDQGDRVLSAGRDGLLIIQDLVTGASLQTLEVSPTLDRGAQDASRPPGSASRKDRMKAFMTWSADLSADGRLVAAGGDGDISLWDVSTGKLLRTIVVGEALVSAVRMTRDARRVVTGSADGTVSVYKLETGERLHLLSGHSDAVTTLAVTPDDLCLVTAGEDQTIRVWNLLDGACLSTFGDEESGPLVPARVSREMRLAAPEPPSAAGVAALLKTRADYMHRPVRLAAQRVLAICVDRTGEFALRAIGPRLELWNVRRSCRVRSIDAHPGLVLAADLTADARFAVTVGVDRQIRVWDLATGECQQSMHTDQEPWSVQFSPNGESLFVGEFGSVTQWTLDWELRDDGEKEVFLAEPPVSPPRNEELVAAVERFLGARDDPSEDAMNHISSSTARDCFALRPILIDRLPALIARLRSAKNEPVARAAAFLLFGVGDTVVPLVAPLLSSRNPHTVFAVTHLLFSIGPQTIPTLCETLRAGDPQARAASLATLATFGPMARAAVSEISQVASETHDPRIREAAVDAMRRILDPEQADRPVSDWSLFRAIRRVAVLLLLVGGAWWGLRRFSAYRAERHALLQARQQAPEHVRHARSIVRMWSAGVFADQLPSVSLSHAQSLLDDTLRVTDEEAVRREAEQLRDSITARPHFARLAGRLAEFKSRFPDLRELLTSIASDDHPEQPLPSGDALPSFLVVTTKRPQFEQTDAQEDSLYFDAELNDALGDAAALSPSELKTLIAISFDSTSLDEVVYELPQSQTMKGEPPMRFKVPVLHHVCRVLLIDIERRALRGVQRLEEIDRKPQAANPWSGQSEQQESYRRLRKRVRRVIQDLSATR
ncbi:protein kinase domain-containing protein [Planctomyces sp. SH-PL14]|uniref:protein kinase domain-containing protein n=1 Tax=Planctomyces sp. SH-PL14 TaxID=1632864 RepID=UPI00078D7FCB|nr:protein kinase [Planctomyces sp. SH-PL14]AMV19845.1 Serine/threonine-protein kinase PK-1 [Planctomyces sp. SH-PL14]